MREPGYPCFPSRLEIRVQVSLPHAVAIAADRSMTTVSEYLRRAIVRQLKADGIDPAHPEVRTA